MFVEKLFIISLCVLVVSNPPPVYYSASFQLQILVKIDFFLGSWNLFIGTGTSFFSRSFSLTRMVSSISLKPAGIPFRYSVQGQTDGTDETVGIHFKGL
jgi:hypothetical protein